MKFLSAAALTFIIFLSGDGISQERLSAAGKFLEKNRIFRGEVHTPEDYDRIKTVIQEKPDPESKFGYIVFSIARHSSKLLTNEQAEQLDNLIKKRNTAEINWHDVRNIVRVYALISMWDYALEKDEVEAARLKLKWEKWTDLRLDYMFQEFVDKERFQRKAWEMLTAEQRQKLLNGDWNSYLKRNTGHKRLFSADKQARLALGKPDITAAFDMTTKAWQVRWHPMLEKYWRASRFQNRREFSMDEADETFAIASWQEYVTAFRDFVEYERDALREIVQAGYEIDSGLSEKVTALQEKIRSQMIKKYRPAASNLLRLLGEIE